MFEQVCGNDQYLYQSSSSFLEILYGIETINWDPHFIADKQLLQVFGDILQNCHASRSYSTPSYVWKRATVQEIDFDKDPKTESEQNKFISRLYIWPALNAF